MTAIQKAREALVEAIEFADQDFQVLTPTGEEMVNRWRAALASLEGERETAPASVPEDVAGVEPVVRFKMSARCDWRDEIGHYTTVSETQSETGEWVRYADHASVLARVAKERDEARANAEIVCNSYADENQRLHDRATSAEAKLAEARKVIERYWKGAYWAAMADHDADVVNAFLEETK